MTRTTDPDPEPAGPFGHPEPRQAPAAPDEWEKTETSGVERNRVTGRLRTNIPANPTKWFPS